MQTWLKFRCINSHARYPFTFALPSRRSHSSMSMPPMSTILPSTSTPPCGALFLGSIEVSIDTETLQANSIWHIVQVLGKWPVPLKDEGYAYNSVPVEDRVDQNITKYLEEACAFIEQHRSQGQNVLVHCFEGKSRSATVVIAYLIKYHSMSFDEALSFVRGKRPGIKPNTGFVEQLKKWAQDCQ